MKVSVFRGAILFVAGAMTAAVLAQAQQAPKDSKPAAQTAAPATSATAAAVNPSAMDVKAKASQPLKEASASQKPADDSVVFLRDVANAGFKPEHVRGNQMYCRTTTEIGSNFPVKTCYNEEQVRVKISEYQAERMEMQRKGTLPQFCNKTYAPQC